MEWTNGTYDCVIRQGGYASPPTEMATWECTNWHWERGVRASRMLIFNFLFLFFNLWDHGQYPWIEIMLWPVPWSLFSFILTKHLALHECDVVGLLRGQCYGVVNLWKFKMS